MKVLQDRLKSRRPNLRRDSLGRPSPFDLARPDAAPRIEAVVKLIVSMPEFQLQ